MAEINESKSQEVAPSVNIVNQYLKKIDFNNLLFPSSITLSQTERPMVDVDLSANANAIDSELFEVQISGKISAKYQETDVKLFNLEFSYAAIFRMTNVPEAEKEILLLVYCPSIIFPFIRRIVADVTGDAGFPAVMIDMVDFGKLYQNNIAAKNSKL